MSKAPAVVLTALIGLTACADVGAMPVAEAPPPAAAASPAALPPGPSGPTLPAFGPTWRVRHATCAQLLAAPAPARRDAAMFYYGYFVARNGIATIAPDEIGPVLGRVMDQCARAPSMEIADAFQQRLATPPRWFWQVP